MTATVIKVGTATVIMTGIEFMTYANRYYDAEKALRGQTRDEWFDPIPYHLLCQSLELHLKSFIWLCDGLPRDRFRREYGHNIIKLWRHAKLRGINKYCAVTQLRDDTINLIGPYYKDRKFGYLDLSMSWSGIPILRVNTKALPTIRRLCNQLQKSLNRPVLRAS